MENAFVVFYDSKVLVVLSGFRTVWPSPMTEHVLDWYAKEYAFERKRLTGCYAYECSIDQNMKYEDFVAA